jgi:hypothetical protein
MTGLWQQGRWTGLRPCFWPPRACLLSNGTPVSVYYLLEHQWPPRACLLSNGTLVSIYYLLGHQCLSTIYWNNTGHHVPVIYWNATDSNCLISSRTEPCTIGTCTICLKTIFWSTTCDTGTTSLSNV